MVFCINVQVFMNIIFYGVGIAGETLVEVNVRLTLW